MSKVRVGDCTLDPIPTLPAWYIIAFASEELIEYTFVCVPAVVGVKSKIFIPIVFVIVEPTAWVGTLTVNPDTSLIVPPVALLINNISMPLIWLALAVVVSFWATKYAPQIWFEVAVFLLFAENCNAFAPEKGSDPA